MWAWSRVSNVGERPGRRRWKPARLGRILTQYWLSGIANFYGVLKLREQEAGRGRSRAGSRKGQEQEQEAGGRKQRPYEISRRASRLLTAYCLLPTSAAPGYGMIWITPSRGPTGASTVFTAARSSIVTSKPKSANDVLALISASLRSRTFTICPSLKN